MKRINVSRQGKWYLPGPESETLGRIEVEVVRFNAGCDDVTVALDALGDALAALSGLVHQLALAVAS